LRGAQVSGVIALRLGGKSQWNPPLRRPHRFVKHEKSILHLPGGDFKSCPMMQNRDPAYWRAQAAEARAAAADMTDPKAKRTLEKIAASGTAAA